MTDQKFQIFSFKSANGLSIVYFTSINITRLSSGNNNLKKMNKWLFYLMTTIKYLLIIINGSIIIIIYLKITKL